MAVEDIARDLSIAEDTVRGWIREKKLPAYRVGKEYRIKIVDYERFLDSAGRLMMTTGREIDYVCKLRHSLANCCLWP